MKDGVIEQIGTPLDLFEKPATKFVATFIGSPSMNMIKATITNQSSKLFSVGRKFKVGRYHSLKLNEPFNSKNFDITMRCVTTNAAMSFENNVDKIYGFQFHPESFLTINGNLLIKKILSA